MTPDAEQALRQKMARLMSDGLVTQTEPFPQDNEQFAQLVAQCGRLAPDDLVGKMVLTGWVDRPHGEDALRCHECIYYMVNRRWCELPELDLPAEPHWWCRLWRI